jgi:hypothetical protein
VRGLSQEAAMTVEFRGISPAGEVDSYRLLLDIDKRPYLFVVRLQREPVFGISAPHSFWMLCAEHDISTAEILDLVRRADVGETLTGPVAMKSAESAPQERDPRLWGATSGCYLPEQSLRRAAEYFAQRADTSLFPKAFEYPLISDRWDDFAPIAKRIDLLAHRIAGHRQMLAPKASNGYRVATQLDPLDTILLTACVFQLGEIFEAARVPREEGVVHSFRFSGLGGRLWDPEYGYSSFVERTRELLSERDTSFVVETDISSFYHRVPVDVATRALERAGADRRLLEGVRRMMLSFSSLGLPVGPTPAAFFAEALLNEIDTALLASKARFVRFNDDYRFFCRTETEARARLQHLADLLWRTSSLTLQDAKTQIFDLETYHQRSTPKDGWLTELKRQVLAHDPDYGDPDPQQLDAHEHELLQSAREVLAQAISSKHVAWIRICRTALDALPLRDRFDMLPSLIAQFTRLKPIARSISNCLVQFGRRRRDDAGELLKDAVRSALQDEVPDGPDFGRTWLTRSFAADHWPAVERLLAISRRWPGDGASKREILLAFRTDPALARRVEYDPTDPWQRRAAISAVGVGGLNGRRLESEEQRWNALLDAVVGSVDRGDPFTEH